MLYLGVDVHKRGCWVTVLEADGQEREQGKLGMEKATLLGYFGKIPRPAAVAVEATFNWYYFLNVIEPLGLELVAAATAPAEDQGDCQRADQARPAGLADSGAVAARGVYRRSLDRAAASAGVAAVAAVSHPLGALGDARQGPDRREAGEFRQGRCFDRALRTVKEYLETAEYMNPVRRGLVKRAEKWKGSSVRE